MHDPTGDPRYRDLPPEPAHEWQLPATRGELIAALDAARVPLDATAAQARVRLELHGVWATYFRIHDAQCRRGVLARRAAMAPASMSRGALV
jgi:hypothetical protein